MKISFLVTALLLAFSVGALPQQPNQQPIQRANPALAQIQDEPGLPRVLLIGDSISIGYTLPVRALLKGKANVHRIPVNGGDTQRGVKKLTEWLGAGKWDVIHFNWGLHDLRLNEGRHAVPLDQYEANLRALTQQLQATGAQLIWCSTTPVPAGELNPPRQSADVMAYNEAAARVMRAGKIPTNDLYAYANEHARQWQLPVNVHYQAEGYASLAQPVAEQIAAALTRIKEQRKK
jgi:acyl-CoA thioesterase-1